MANSLKDLLAKNKASTEKKPNNPFAGLKALTAKQKVKPADIIRETTQAKPVNTAPALTGTETIRPEQTLAKEFSFDSQSEGLDVEAMAGLQNALNMLQENINNKELVSEAVKNVLNLLNKYDFLKKIIKPEDCGLMVRGLRNSYGTTIAKKEARSSKAKATSAEVDDVLNQLDSLEISL